MPIDFNNQDALGRLNDLFGNPTGWGRGVISALTAAFGPSNPFNSAALADTGDAAGQVPVLGPDGVQERHLKPASATTAGAVRTASGRTTSRASNGFPLVLAASLVADVLQASTLEQNLFGAPVIVRPSSIGSPVALPTQEGFFLAVAAGESRASPTTTTFRAQDFNTTRGFSITLDNARFGTPLPANVEVISQADRGNVIRFGLRLRMFGRLNSRNFQHTPGDVVFGYKETTPDGMRLSISGGLGIAADASDSALFVVFPVN